MQEIMGLINDAFEKLQYLEIQPTMMNVTTLYISLSNLREAYTKLKEISEQQKEETDGER